MFKALTTIFIIIPLFIISKVSFIINHYSLLLLEQVMDEFND